MIIIAALFAPMVISAIIAWPYMLMVGSVHANILPAIIPAGYNEVWEMWIIPTYIFVYLYAGWEIIKEVFL